MKKNEKHCLVGAWHECAWQHCWWADNCKQHCCPIVALIVVEVTTLAPPPFAPLCLCPWPTFMIVMRQFFSRTRCLCWTAPPRTACPWTGCPGSGIEQHWLLSNTANCAFENAIKVNEFLLRCLRSTNFLFVLLSIKCYCCFYSVYQHCRWELNVYWMCGSSNFLNVVLKSHLKHVLSIANNTCRCPTLVAYISICELV